MGGHFSSFFFAVKRIGPVDVATPSAPGSASMNDAFPRMIHVRQNFPHLPRLDVEWEKIRSHIEAGTRIAVAERRLMESRSFAASRR